MKQQIFNVFRKNRKVVIVMSLLTLIDAMLSFFIPVSITYLLTSVVLLSRHLCFIIDHNFRY